MTLVRVLLVDDNDSVRRGLMVFLGTCEDMEVVGQASNCEDALNFCRLYNPDVMLVDVVLGFQDGIELIQTVRQETNHIRAIILSGFLDEPLLRRALAAGVAGYLEKNISVDFLANAIRAVHRGERVFNSTAQEIFNRIQRENGGDTEGS